MDNVLLINRFNDEIWNKGNLGVVDEVIDPHFVTHSLHYNPQPVGKEQPINYKEAVKVARAALTGYHREFKEIISKDDSVIVRWIITGKHTGNFMGIKPTNKTISFNGISIFKIFNGKIKEEWYVWDRLGLFQQLEVVKI